MKFEKTEVFNFEGALRGMRNPLNSWERSDSKWDGKNYKIGENDLNLAQRLIRGGSEHRKFMRDILVSVDITAARYWWLEMATYKIGTNFNSTSTMHKLLARPLTIEDFEVTENSPAEFISDFNNVINTLNKMMDAYNKEEDPDEKNKIFMNIKQLLPESFLNKRTCTFNYEMLRNAYFQRKSHRQPEWSKHFIDWVKSLPYAEELITLE